MHEFATLPQEDRADAVIVAAREKGMHPAVGEKEQYQAGCLRAADQRRSRDIPTYRIDA